MGARSPPFHGRYVRSSQRASHPRYADAMTCSVRVGELSVPVSGPPIDGTTSLVFRCPEVTLLPFTQRARAGRAAMLP